MMDFHRELFYEPVRILGDMYESQAEMDRDELAFLCGLIKKYRPQKLVEKE